MITNNSQINAGTYYALVSLNDKINYEWPDGTTADLSLQWKILQAEPEGYEIPAGLTARVGDILSSIELSREFSWKVPETVLLEAGECEFTVIYTPDDVNYKAVELKVTVTVLRKDDSFYVTANGVSITYDGQPKTISFIGLENGDEVVYKTAVDSEYDFVKPEFINAGNYTIWYKVSRGGDYLEGEVEIVINKAILMVRANNASRKTGEDNPAFSYYITGFVNGENSSVIQGSFFLSTSATISSPAGTYTITINPGGASADNYNFRFVNGTLTVTEAATLDITANGVDTIYDGQAKTISFNGLEDGDKIEYKTAIDGDYGSENPGFINAGEYTIWYKVSRDGGYIEGSVKIIINKATLTVTANNASKKAGEANPAFGYSIAGFVNGEDASVISGGFKLSTIANTSSAAGSYDIAIENEDASADNYNFILVSGKLTVTAAGTTDPVDPADPGNPGDPINPGEPKLGGNDNGATIGIIIGCIALACVGAILMIVFISRRRKQNMS